MSSENLFATLYNSIERARMFPKLTEMELSVSRSSSYVEVL